MIEKFTVSLTIKKINQLLEYLYNKYPNDEVINYSLHCGDIDVLDKVTKIESIVNDEYKHSAYKIYLIREIIKG